MFRKLAATCRALLEHPKYGELLRFIIGGGLTTVCNFAVYIPCYYLLFEPRLGEETASAVSNGFAWVLAVLFAFFINKYLVFRSDTNSRDRFVFQLVSFYATRVASGVPEIFLPSFLVWLGMNNLIAKIIVSVLVIILNYLTSKFIAFRKRK